MRDLGYFTAHEQEIKENSINNIACYKKVWIDYLTKWTYNGTPYDLSTLKNKIDESFLLDSDIKSSFDCHKFAKFITNNTSPDSDSLNIFEWTIDELSNDLHWLQYWDILTLSSQWDPRQHKDTYLATEQYEKQRIQDDLDYLYSQERRKISDLCYLFIQYKKANINKPFSSENKEIIIENIKKMIGDQYKDENDKRALWNHIDSAALCFKDANNDLVSQISQSYNIWNTNTTNLTNSILSQRKISKQVAETPSMYQDNYLYNRASQHSMVYIGNWLVISKFGLTDVYITTIKEAIQKYRTSLEEWDISTLTWLIRIDKY
jgi:hypothetical protein